MEEKTFIAVKPDGVKRGLVGEVIKRFEHKGFKLIAMKMLNVTKEMAEAHYAEHKGKVFYPRLIEYLQSGPIVAMVWKGFDVIKGARVLMGSTNPNEAQVGTIRADYAQVKEYNIVHGSDSPASAEREINIYFTPEEMCDDYENMSEIVTINLDND
ncbi:MAG: nucleoside-diphosphate kinase [Clostridiaceae bacterium]|jgi:nucleoside-diphosphate kinase|nr:nucleoside-diphosphate kinase [Clostridiaceae bacterium]